MQIIACEDRTDLRTIISKSKFLHRVAKEYRLRNDQAVCFTNKALTRFRLVFKVGKALFMCIPEIDDTEKHSVYLKISEQLAVLAGIKSRIKFDFFRDHTKGRILRQKQREGRTRKKNLKWIKLVSKR